MKNLICLVMLIFPLYNLIAQNESDTDAKYREFDFWVGEWVVFRTGTGDTLGFSKIDTIVHGFAIQETYQSAKSKYSGTSINKYNPVTGQWEQYYVDNTGLTLHLKGRKKGNSMVLENQLETDDGTLGNRITWAEQKDGSVQQIWEQSSDNGESWNKIFDGLYKKKKAGKSKKAEKNKD